MQGVKPAAVRPLKKKVKAKQKPVIGWREWVALPDLHIPHIKAKVDTGARTSALHAYDIAEFRKHGHLWVRFKVHPYQRNPVYNVKAEARVVDQRHVRNSGGEISFRPVIETVISLGDYHWKIELTLVDRSEMGFRMLLGREAVKARFVIDAARSSIVGKDPRPKHKTTKV